MKNLKLTTILVFTLPALLSISCSSSDDVNVCGSASAIPLEAGSCLVFEDSGELDNERADIETVVKTAVIKVNQKIKVADVQIKVRADASNAIAEIGLGGFNPNANEIIISINPNFPNLNQSITNELEAQIAHELNHAKRRTTVGYGSSLLEAMVSEGMADCFAMEISGIDPPIWSIALKGEELDLWLDEANDHWTEDSYSHNAWFFGTTQEIPRWTGYALGFKLVKDYLDAHPDLKASDLIAEPAISFVQ